MHLGVIVQQLSIARPQTPQQFVDFVHQHEFTGTAREQDVVNFLDRAKQVCDESKKDALQKLAEIAWLETSGCFPELNGRRVVVQTALRILKPKIIDQRGYGLCGPVAFMVTILKSHPLSVAHLVVDLMLYGRGRLDAMNIEPDDSVCRFRPTGSIEDADWLLLASLRNERINQGQIADAAHYGGTNIAEMFGWLKTAGYPSIVSIPSNNALGDGFLSNFIPSVAMTDYHPHRPAFLADRSSSAMTSPGGSLDLARAFVDNGWKILFCVTEVYANTLGDTDPVNARTQAVRQAYELTEQPVDEAAVAQARRQAIANLVGESTNHWVIVSDIVVASGKVRIHRYSWGNKAWTAPIDREIFLTVFGGFIALHLAPLNYAERFWQEPNYPG